MKPNQLRYFLGSSPGFINLAQENYHLSSGNPLLLAGTKMTVFKFLLALYFSNIQNHYRDDNAFINPLMLPEFEPQGKDSPAIPLPRNNNNIAVGAY